MRPNRGSDDDAIHHPGRRGFLARAGAFLCGAGVLGLSRGRAFASLPRTVDFVVSCRAPASGDLFRDIGVWTDAMSFPVSLVVAGVSVPFSTEGGAPVLAGERLDAGGTAGPNFGKPAIRPYYLGVGIHGMARLERDAAGADVVIVVLRRPRMVGWDTFVAKAGETIQLPKTDATPYELSLVLPRLSSVASLAIPDGSGHTLTVRRP